VHKIASNKTVPRDALMKIWSDARKGPAAPMTPAAAAPVAAPAAAPRGYLSRLDELPALAERRDPAPLRAALGSLGAVLRAPDDGNGDDGGVAPPPMVELLPALLQGLARCMARVGVRAADAWPALYIEHLLWAPQRRWRALHDALWGWARVAVAGLAGAHERPLALLLVHLATLERAASARERAVAQPCADCDAHARTLFGGRPLSGCSAAALLVRLPIGSAAERAWALRLGGACVELACTAFDHVDVGKAQPDGWRDAEAVDGAAVQRAYVPGALLRLLRWLAERRAGGGAEDDEAAAARSVGELLQAPPAAVMLAAAGAAAEEEVWRWEAQMEVE